MICNKDGNCVRDMDQCSTLDVWRPLPRLGLDLRGTSRNWLMLSLGAGKDKRCDIIQTLCFLNNTMCTNYFSQSVHLGECAVTQETCKLMLQ